MVRRPRPVPRLVDDAHGDGRAVERRRRPDMIEPPPAIGGAPIAIAIAPPRVKLLLCRHMPAHDVHPVMRGLHRREPFDLFRRVAHHLQELFMRPDIGRQRRNVEIADHDHAIRGLVRHAAEPCFHGIEKIELVAKFWVQHGIGSIAARWHVDIMQDNGLRSAGSLAHGDREVARMAAAANVAALELRERQAR